MNIEINSIGYLLLRTTLIFMTLLILTRLLGKKQMGQLTFFNYVTGITIGSIAANVISDDGAPFLDEFIGLTWWCILTALISFICLKFDKIKFMVEGEPILIIKKGKIKRKALKKARISTHDLLSFLRQKDIFKISEVEYGVFEQNGTITVLKKADKQQVTLSDLQIKTQQIKFYPSELIIMGKVIKCNLKELGLSEEWLMKELRKNDIGSVKDVFYAEVESDGTLFINKY